MSIALPPLFSRADPLFPVTDSIPCRNDGNRLLDAVFDLTPTPHWTPNYWDGDVTDREKCYRSVRIIPKWRDSGSWFNEFVATQSFLFSFRFLTNTTAFFCHWIIISDHILDLIGVEGLDWHQCFQFRCVEWEEARGGCEKRDVSMCVPIFVSLIFSRNLFVFFFKSFWNYNMINNNDEDTIPSFFQN